MQQLSTLISYLFIRSVLAAGRKKREARRPPVLQTVGRQATTCTMVAQLLQLLFCAFLLLKPIEALATRGVFGLQHAPHRYQGVARARSSLALKSVVECKDEACNFVEEVVTASKDTFVIVDFYAGIFSDYM